MKLTAVPGTDDKFELLAILKNVTSYAAGIETIAFRILDANVDPTKEDYPVRDEKGDWLGNDIIEWKLPHGDKKHPPILTRNTTWQLATLYSLPAEKKGQLQKLIAVCCIGMQPPEQTIYYQKLFPMDAIAASPVLNLSQEAIRHLKRKS